MRTHVRVKMHTRLVVDKAGAGARKAVKLAAADVEREAKMLTNAGGGSAAPGASGAYYYGAPLHRWVRASAPGEPPHKQTAAIQSSIAFEIAPDGLSALVGPSVYYGKFLEFGTRRMAARPFVRPALAHVLPRIQQYFRGMF